MNQLEKAAQIGQKGKLLIGRLQPVVDPPRHLNAVRGFVEWKWEKKIIEVTVFARLKFYAKQEEGFLRANPKMRYDMEIDEEAFLGVDQELLYDMIMYHVEQAFSQPLLGPEYTPIEGIRHGWGTAIEFALLEGGNNE